MRGVKAKAPSFLTPHPRLRRTLSRTLSGERGECTMSTSLHRACVRDEVEYSPLTVIPAKAGTQFIRLVLAFYGRLYRIFSGNHRAL